MPLTNISMQAEHPAGALSYTVSPLPARASPLFSLVMAFFSYVLLQSSFLLQLPEIRGSNFIASVCVRVCVCVCVIVFFSYYSPHNGTYMMKLKLHNKSS